MLLKSCSKPKTVFLPFLIKYFKTLKRRKIFGINNLTPSYNKLIISYDLKKTNFKDMKKIVENIYPKFLNFYKKILN